MACAGCPDGTGGGVLRDETWRTSARTDTTGKRTRDVRSAFEEQRMSKFLMVARAAGAALLVLGLCGPAWATYGGGASYRCCSAPVVVAQCDVAALAPQCQTVLQTVHETVYESQPVTVLQTRYR